MKHNRGSRKCHKKVKVVEPPVMTDAGIAPVYVNTEDTAYLDQSDGSQHNSEMDIEPSPLGSDKPNNLSVTEADSADDKSKGKAGHSHLRVKLKSSRALEPHQSYSDIQTPSDTDKSNQQSAQLNDAAVEMDDSACSDGQTSEMQNTSSEKFPRKAGTIKIKSSKGLGFSSEGMRDKNLNKIKSPQMLGERNLVVSGDERTADSSAHINLQQREIKPPYRDAHYNDKELGEALLVIKKIMKMDAAGPFNNPVDPIALGIPDYFDIIDTPMDFGTICHNLAHGHKYTNSEDVLRDVQYIWENCYKYNNKGDFIVDLMKRVKKNFMKYWMAAGLYLDMPSNGATNSTQIQGKVYNKGKPKHKRRRHGIDLHKSDCLCAVCVVRRKRKEREESSAVIEGQMRISEANLSREFKLEESSPVTNQWSEGATSSLDHSQETDANADMEEVGKEKMMTLEEKGTGETEIQEPMDDDMEVLPNASGSSGSFLHLQLDSGVQEDSNKHSQEDETDLGFTGEPVEQKDGIEVQQQDQIQERNQDELADRSRLQISVHNPLQQENHSALHICKRLFPSDFRSVWNGPHSLKRHHISTTRDSPIYTAVTAFMKQELPYRS